MKGVDPTLHGSARWASLEDMRRVGLLDGRGVYVGGIQKGKQMTYLRAGGEEHVMVMAPTGSGKTVSLVVPNLLSWPESCFILDLKGELWDLTAGWRRDYAGNRVLRFDPASSTNSCRFNPVAEIRMGSDHAVADAQNLALLLVDPDGKGVDDHWRGAAQGLMAGCMLYLCLNDPLNASLPGLDRLLSNPGHHITQLWEWMAAFPDPTVAQSGQDMINRGNGQEAKDVISTAQRFLTLYRDPTVGANVSSSDFQIRQLMHHADPVSLYLITAVPDKDRLRPLIRILCNLALRRLATGKTTQPDYRHKLLLMLDEFPSLRRLAIMEESLAFIRGYGLRAFLVSQDLTQLKEAYGQNESIRANCGIHVAFPPSPSNLETAEALSKMTGEETRVRPTVSRTGFWFTTSITRGVQETRRYLLTPNEVTKLRWPTKDSKQRITAPGEMLLFTQGQSVRGTQPCFFFDPDFRARSEIPAPTRSDPV